MAAQQFDAVLAHADSGVVPFNYNDRIGNRLVETEEQLIAGELNFLYIEVRSWLCTLFKIQEPFTPDPIPSWHVLCSRELYGQAHVGSAEYGDAGCIWI